MAYQFLDQLAKIPEDEVPEDSTCMICRQKYSYGTDGEPAVRLPCNHHVGLMCISIWLSPDDFQNSCPMCRQVFFDVIGWEEDRDAYARSVVRRVGQPPPVGHAQGDTPDTWYHYFVEAAAEQYEESLARAAAILPFPEPARKPASSEIPEEERMLSIEYVARAFRTLAVRDTLLYFEFARDGAFPPLAGPITGPLNAEQLEALFQELRRRGAFEPDLHEFPWWASYEGMTDREKWLRHREEGESYCSEEGGFWSLMLG